MLQSHILTAFRVVIWGPHFIILYNESCCDIIGDKHPAALGRPPTVAFAELWPMVLPMVSAAYHHGKPTKVEKMELHFSRREDVAVSTSDTAQTASRY